MQFNTIRSWNEIDRVCKIAKEMDHCDFIVAIGGGKAVDLGKGVATVILSLLIVIVDAGSSSIIMPFYTFP